MIDQACNALDMPALYQHEHTACFRQGMQARTEEEQVLDKVFRQVYIPRSLEEVDEYERDHDRLAGVVP